MRLLNRFLREPARSFLPASAVTVLPATKNSRAARSFVNQMIGCPGSIRKMDEFTPSSRDFFWMIGKVVFFESVLHTLRLKKNRLRRHAADAGNFGQRSPTQR